MEFLSELDELARGPQLRAISLTYLTGLAAMGFLASWGPVIHPLHFDPRLCFLLLEPVRGFWLWRLGRRY